jgi:hypothetical protein
VTVPSLTDPPVLVTVADRVTDWADSLNVAVAGVTVVVEAVATIRLPEPVEVWRLVVPL